jgi:hypothetical protein
MQLAVATGQSSSAVQRNQGLYSPRENHNYEITASRSLAGDCRPYADHTDYKSLVDKGRDMNSPLTLYMAYLLKDVALTGAVALSIPDRRELW